MQPLGCWDCSSEVLACPPPPSSASSQLHFPSFLRGRGSPRLSSCWNDLAEGQFRAQAKLPPPEKLIRRQQESFLFHLGSMKHICLRHSQERLGHNGLLISPFINSLHRAVRGEGIQSALSRSLGQGLRGRGPGLGDCEPHRGTRAPCRSAFLCAKAERRWLLGSSGSCISNKGGIATGASAGASGWSPARA